MAKTTMTSLGGLQGVRLIRLGAGIIMIALFSAFAAEWFKPALLNRLNAVFYDLRLQATLENRFDPRIVIVDIDDKSLEMEGRWPWHRDKIAYLVDILFDYYAVQVLGFDIVFSEPDRDAGLDFLQQLIEADTGESTELEQAYDQMQSRFDYDQLLASSLAGRRVVTGYYTALSDSGSSVGQLPAALAAAADFPFADHLYTPSHYIGNLPILQSAADHGGFFNNPLVDDDGVYRGLPLLQRIDNSLYEALSLAVVRTLSETAAVQFNVSEDYGGDSQLLETIHIDSYSIPVNRQSRILIPYRGNSGSFPYVSATDILNGVVDVETMQGKIVLVGTTAAGIYDQRSTPVQSVFPGVEVHANVVSGILDGTIKSRPGYTPALELLYILVIGLLMAALFPRLQPGLMALALILVLAMTVGVSVYVWTVHNIDTRLATPLLLALLLYANQMFFGFFFESRRKKQLGSIFGQYIPKELVADMSREPEDYALQGERRVMTVFFSDIRNFTNISEQLESRELVTLINEVLTPITDAIHSNQGTIDKYIGDAVMAFWGAPRLLPNHAPLAVQSALQVVQALADAQGDYSAKNWPEIRIGVGVATGPMTVGNMGSEFRLSYTVMGDTVNLGSRLEGLTKNYGVDIIVSAATMAAAPDFLYRELDLVRVKGKAEAIAIYEPIGAIDAVSSEQCEEVKQAGAALVAYRKQDWDSASTLFHTLLALSPEDVLYQLYLDRIRVYELDSPPADWDGVFIYTSK